MGRAVLPRSNFVAGILSPQLLARDDLEAYQQGLRRCSNFVVLPYGGITFRPGFGYVNEVKSSAYPVRLLPFQYSTTEAYIIEAGDYYFRFYAKGGQVVDGSGVPVEVVTPWSYDEVWDLDTAQSADVMYIVHPDYMPRKLTRTTVTSFSLSTVAFSRGRAPVGQFNNDADNYITTITGTWPNLTYTFMKDTFTAADIGKYIYLRNVKAKNAYYGQITGVTSAKIITVTGLDRYSSTGTNPQGTEADRWALSIFSSTSGCSCVAFHEGRLWYGGFTSSPTMLWGSVSDDFENFEIQSPDPTAEASLNDDKAIQRQTLSSGGQVSTCRFLAGVADTLMVGASGAEFLLQPDTDGILTPSSAAIKRRTNRGVAPVKPVVIDNNVFFIERSGRRIRQFLYDIMQSGYLSKDISLRAQHLLTAGGGVRAMAYQQNPYSVLWVLHLNGALSAWTIEREQQVNAAHEHSVGGSLLGSDAFVESIAVIPGEFTYSQDATLTGYNGSITSMGTNLGAESGSTTGWTATNWSASAGSGPVTPQTGSYFFLLGSAAADQTMTQTITLGGSISTDMIDQGMTSVDLSAYITRTAAGGYLDISVEALTTDGSSLGTVYSLVENDPRLVGGVTCWSATTAGTWENLQTGQFALPPLTRKIKVTLTGNPTDHTPVAGASACVDTITLNIHQIPPIADGMRRTAEDQLWAVVRRTINGCNVRYIEVLGTSFEPPLSTDATDKDRTDALDDAAYLDSSLELNNPLNVLYISSADPAIVFTDGAHGLGDGDVVRFRDVRGAMTDLLDQRRFTATLRNSTSFYITPVGSDTQLSTVGVQFTASTFTAAYKEVSTISELGHLEGEVVTVFADGSPQPDRTVIGGSITLERPASRVLVGLPYSGIAETMPLFGVSRVGTDQAKPKGTGRIAFRLYNSLGGRVGRGSAPATWETLSYRIGSSVIGRPPPMLTGDKTVSAEGSWRMQLPTVTIQQNQPLPLTLLGMYIDLESGDD